MGKTKDYEVKIAEKVEALLQKMTLREKVGQVTQIALIGDIEAIKEKIRRGEVGSLILAGDAYAGHSSYSTKTEMLDELQRIAVEESPHGSDHQRQGHYPRTQHRLSAAACLRLDLQSGFGGKGVCRCRA